MIGPLVKKLQKNNVYMNAFHATFLLENKRNPTEAIFPTQFRSPTSAEFYWVFERPKSLVKFSNDCYPQDINQIFNFKINSLNFGLFKTARLFKIHRTARQPTANYRSDFHFVPMCCAGIENLMSESLLRSSVRFLNNILAIGDLFSNPPTRTR